MLPTFVQPNPSNDQFQAAFLDFFHDFDSQSVISTRVEDSSGMTASLRVFFDQKKVVTAQPSIGFQAGLSPVTPGPPTTIIPLAFERKDFQGQNSTLLITLDANGNLQMQPGKIIGHVSGFFSNAYFGVPQENAAWLSALSVQKRNGEVVEALRRHFPFIRDVTSESIAFGMATVYADIPSVPRKLPLSLVSGGISRLFTLMLAIVTFKDGVVFIDEVENGIFHEQYALMWKTLFDLAVHNKTQLFVSTHSSDCLKALIPVMEANADDFRLLRVTKDNGTSSVKEAKGPFLEAALEQNFEVR
ncbi:MAG: AAA family ATPase [Candidatus Sulfotelmatobacter sp.]